MKSIHTYPKCRINGELELKKKLKECSNLSKEEQKQLRENIIRNLLCPQKIVFDDKPKVKHL